MEKNQKKGFTLIELLVVIAILAVLATAVVIILNPAQLVRQGRDSTRVSDLAALHSAIALYLSDVVLESADLGTCGGARCTANDGNASPFNSGGSNTTCTASTSTDVTGSGWVDINFGSISAGSPLSKLPIDPVNSDTYYYAYACNDTAKTFEIDANMESTKYSTDGGGDVESNNKDGGDTSTWYEIGNDPGLDL